MWAAILGLGVLSIVLGYVLAIVAAAIGAPLLLWGWNLGVVAAFGAPPIGLGVAFGVLLVAGVVGGRFGAHVAAKRD